MSGLEPPPPYSRDDPHSPTAADGQTSGITSNTSAVPALTVSTPHPSDSSQPHQTELQSPAYEEASQDPASPSPVSQNVVLTPPASPRPTEHQHNDTGLDETTLSASATYFESRPSIMQPPTESFVYQLVLLPDSGPGDLSFPEPEHMWSSRDVTQQDWDTFKNFLFPYYQMEANAQLAERKLLAELDRREEDLANGATTESPTDELYPAQLQALPGVQEQNEKRSLGRNTSEPEAERSQRINLVVAEWNEGFFLPRGFHIESTLVPYPTMPPSPSASSFTVVNPSSQQNDEPSSVPLAETHQPLPHRHSSDSSTLHTSGSTSASNVDDDPLLALRQAFGKFLLSSRDEMGEAFDDLGSELRSQKSANLRALKQELRMQGKELQSEWKNVVEQHKQRSKQLKGKGKWRMDDHSDRCSQKERDKNTRKCQPDLEKIERKQKQDAEKMERKQKQDAEKMERKQQQDAEKRELKEAKKRLKDEHKRQMRELYNSKRKSSTQEAVLDSYSEPATVALPQGSQESGVERVPEPV